MTKELLHIENFAGIRHADIELARMNVFIGPQASGKSVCAKLFFYFKECIKDLASNVLNEQSKAEIRTDNQHTFLKYFPSYYWGKGVFTLRYSFGDLWIEIKRKTSDSKTVEIVHSPYYDRILKNARQALKKLELSSATSFEVYENSRNTAFRAINDSISTQIGMCQAF